MIHPCRSSLSRKPFEYTEQAEGERAPLVRWRRPFLPPRALPRRGAAAAAAESPEEAARAARGFLKAHADILGISPEALQFVRIWRTGSGAHLRFQQLYRSIPVIGALIDVHLGPGGGVSMVTGGFHRRLAETRAAARARAVGKKEAVRRALDDLGRGGRLRAEVTCSELVYVLEGRALVVYKVVLPASRPLGNWVYLIDPGTGSILRSYNTMRFARGRGRVYLNSPAEDRAPTLVPLARLASLSELKGERVGVVNEDFPAARSTDGTFIFAPESPHFDEVMAYYHVDRTSELFRLLDPVLPEKVADGKALRAFVHAGERMDNAYFDPSTHAIYLGDGGGQERLNDLAREAAVIYHEYGHAVLGCINPHLKGAEADALHEGYADYFACSFSGDAQVGEWVMAGRGEPYLRDLTNRKRYPGDLAGEAHSDGEIWAGTCWDLRVALGRETADRLVYESMHFLPEFARFADAALGVVQGDAAIFAERHAGEIAAVLKSRGLPI